MNSQKTRRWPYREHLPGPQRWADVRCASRGITLVELMVVVAVAAILVAIAAPNLSDLFISNRLSTAANELVTAISTARSEAIRRGTVVTIKRCGSVSPAIGCTQASAEAKDWSKGWIVFVDGNRDRQANSGEEVVRVGHAVGEPLTVYQGMQNVGTFANQPGSISFCPDGRLFADDCALPALISEWASVLVICYSNQLSSGNKPRSRAILVDQSGGVRVATHDSSGVPLNEAEAPLTSCREPTYK